MLPLQSMMPVVLCLALSNASTDALAQGAQSQGAPTNCGPIRNAYGPYDYRTDRDKLNLVESAHFLPEVEALIRAVTGYIGADLDYTLRAFPNHHRALVSMMRYGERLKVKKVPNANYEVECYFVRANQFKRDDPIVRMLYATFLSKQQRLDEANQQLEFAKEYAGDNPFTQYNIGVVYMDLNNTDQALQQAHKALALGFPRTDLKDRLQAAGKWVEPAAPTEASGASAPAAASSAASR